MPSVFDSATVERTPLVASYWGWHSTATVTSPPVSPNSAAEKLTLLKVTVSLLLASYCSAITAVTVVQCGLEFRLNYRGFHGLLLSLFGGWRVDAACGFRVLAIR